MKKVLLIGSLSLISIWGFSQNDPLKSSIEKTSEASVKTKEVKTKEAKKTSVLPEYNPEGTKTMKEQGFIEVKSGVYSKAIADSKKRQIIITYRKGNL